MLFFIKPNLKLQRLFWQWNQVLSRYQAVAYLYTWHKVWNLFCHILHSQKCWEVKSVLFPTTPWTPPHQSPPKKGGGGKSIKILSENVDNILDDLLQDVKKKKKKLLGTEKRMTWTQVISVTCLSPTFHNTLLNYTKPGECITVHWLNSRVSIQHRSNAIHYQFQ